MVVIIIVLAPALLVYDCHSLLIFDAFHSSSVVLNECICLCDFEAF